ncbi:hypothetical protein [Streptococcus criceti]|uniref:hypothetical protein n=1 Tax=Streptococcus criceti TaxID=1333 RepID=UPI0009DA0474|nr:hypothetical protein [Streptococcus criceti]
MFVDALYKYESFPVMKYQEIIRDCTIIWILVLLAVLFFSYAYYCTSRGYNFTGMLKWSPTFVEIGCRR